jgi:hypothetical protein
MALMLFLLGWDAVAPPAALLRVADNQPSLWSSDVSAKNGNYQRLFLNRTPA